jgi:hypothetical protein
MTSITTDHDHPSQRTNTCLITYVTSDKNASTSHRGSTTITRVSVNRKCPACHGRSGTNTGVTTHANRAADHPLSYTIPHGTCHANVSLLIERKRVVTERPFHLDPNRMIQTHQDGILASRSIDLNLSQVLIVVTNWNFVDRLVKLLHAQIE